MLSKTEIQLALGLLAFAANAVINGTFIMGMTSGSDNAFKPINQVRADEFVDRLTPVQKRALFEVIIILARLQTVDDNGKINAFALQINDGSFKQTPLFPELKGLNLTHYGLPDVSSGDFFDELDQNLRSLVRTIGVQNLLLQIFQNSIMTMPESYLLELEVQDGEYSFYPFKTLPVVYQAGSELVKSAMALLNSSVRELDKIGIFNQKAIDLKAKEEDVEVSDIKNAAVIGFLRYLLCVDTEKDSPELVKFSTLTPASIIAIISEMVKPRNGTVGVNPSLVPEESSRPESVNTTTNISIVGQPRLEMEADHW